MGWASYAADILDPTAGPWQLRTEEWHRRARPTQLKPGGTWLTWLILAGRGFGKTRTGAETVSEFASISPDSRIALVAQTFTDGRDTMVEGESGLLNCLPAEALRGGGTETAWNRSLGELFFSNGARAKVFSSEKPGQLRGPQHHFAWVDEPAKFKDAGKGDALDTTWNNLLLGLRLGARPQVVVTGTPTNCLLVRQLVTKTETGLTELTRGSTYDNLDNLAPTFREQVLSMYEGTRIGRQELLGEILDDVQGALWSLAEIDALRQAAAPPLFTNVVVAVDPAGGAEETNDETGIVVAGRSPDGHGWVLADRTGRYSPQGWAQRAVAAYHEFSADRIVAEINYGGAMVESTLRAAGFTGWIDVVTASRGKRQRAEPIAALYGDPSNPDSWDRGRIHHVGAFPELEDQMTMWVPGSGDSPDRMDALVWALTSLKFGGISTLVPFDDIVPDKALDGSDLLVPAGGRYAMAAEDRFANVIRAAPADEKPDSLY